MGVPSVSNTGTTSWVDSAEINKSSERILGQEIIEERVPIIVFTIGRESYALPIDMVREVMKMIDITPVPQTPDYILGVSNIRGNVCAVLDLAIKIDPANAGRQPSDTAYIILIKDPVVQVGILVDNVPSTVLVNKSDIDSSASVIENLSLEDAFIDGIVKSRKEMIIMINVLEMLKAEQ